MKVFLTVEIIAIMVFIIGQYKYWSSTFDWRSSDGGLSSYYRVPIKEVELVRKTNFASIFIVLIGFLILIWF